ncbi:MAG: MFS transporter [Acidimicrobiales bacterium]|nr:MAG: MFS transporter [Acidimicrobiales bacterium]
MKNLITQLRSFDRTMQLLCLNQFGINVGFYMLMPYLASYLGGDLGFSVALVGLVLGVRNLSQQGMFLVGGTIADRWGYKPAIITGLVLRTAGFGLLAVVTSLPALIVASIAIGFAGALFNPAVRAYVAARAPQRRVEAFAVFNVAYQAGIVTGPLIGVLLLMVDFRLSCLIAAVLFAALAIIQFRALPTTTTTSRFEPIGVMGSWKTLLSHRPFVVFTLVMALSYVLSYQVYLALPFYADHAFGDRADTAIMVMFAVSGLLAVLTQVRITAWCKQHLGAQRALITGVLLMASAFAPPALIGVSGGWIGVVTLGLTAVLLTIGTLVTFPFEMDTVVTLAGNGQVATYYGFYNTMAGIAIAAGTIGVGALLDLNASTLPWWTLVATGLLCALVLAKTTKTTAPKPRDPARAANVSPVAAPLAATKS